MHCQKLRKVVFKMVYWVKDSYCTLQYNKDTQTENWKIKRHISKEVSNEKLMIFNKNVNKIKNLIVKILKEWEKSK